MTTSDFQLTLLIIYFDRLSTDDGDDTNDDPQQQMLRWGCHVANKLLYVHDQQRPSINTAIETGDANSQIE